MYTHPHTPLHARPLHRRSTMAGTAAARSELETDHTRGVSSSQRCSMMPLWEAPEAWLRLLVNHWQNLGSHDLVNLMSVNWAMCEAALRCMDRRRLVIKVWRTSSHQ